MKAFAKSDYPLVSIITVNYNCTEMTRDLLMSLRQITYQSTEVIVVDNGSRDHSCQLMLSEFPEVQFYRSDENLGYAGGNNLGFRHAHGDLLLAINNDVLVAPNFLEPLVSVFLADRTVGMASPKIIYQGDKGRIQYAGSSGINPWTGRGRKNGHLQPNSDQFSQNAQTQLVHGACIMVSRELLEKVGPFPEEYFLYYEEHDWAESAKRHRFKLFYVGASEITHRASASTGTNSPLKTYYMNRNRLLYLRRNVSGVELLTSGALFLALAVPKRLLLFLIKMDFPNIRALMRGVWWHVSDFGSKFSMVNYKKLSSTPLTK